MESPVNLCSSTDVKNKPDESSTAVGALEVLDNYCWRVVMRNLNAEDLLSCRLVCKPFKLLLEEASFETKWKFHLIVPLLFEYLKTVNMDHLPFRMISWKTLYSVRLTCPSWQQSVDKYASTSDFNEPEFIQTLYRDPLATCFNTAEKFEEFQEKFGESTRNPFPSKTVCVRIPRYFVVEPEPEWGNQAARAEHKEAVKRLKVAYMEKLGDFFEQFGRNIFKLEVFFESECTMGPTLLCKLIKRITVHVPNLKIFLLQFEPDNRHRGQEDNDEEVASYIEENPLAELPKLEALEVHGLNPTAENYLLEKYAPQLTYLVRSYPKNILNEVYTKEFKNVRKMTLATMDHADTFEALRFMEGPLKHLKLHLYSGPLIYNVDKILRNIKNLPIECLELECMLGEILAVEAESIALEEYRNESIKILKIEINYSSKISFNFLEALTKLEHMKLEFVHRVVHPTNVPERVKLSDYLMPGESMGKLYESDVWEKVPSLKTLTVKRQNFGDGGYEGAFTRENYNVSD